VAQSIGQRGRQILTCSIIEDEIREAILAAFNAITPEMAHRATRNIARRADFCLRERGRHFEQFLH